MGFVVCRMTSTWRPRVLIIYLVGVLLNQTQSGQLYLRSVRLVEKCRCYKVPASIFRALMQSSHAFVPKLSPGLQVYTAYLPGAVSLQTGPTKLVEQLGRDASLFEALDLHFPVCLSKPTGELETLLLLHLVLMRKFKLFIPSEGPGPLISY